MNIRGANIVVLKHPKLDDFRYTFDRIQNKGCNSVAINTTHLMCVSPDGGAHVTWPQANWYPHHSLVYPDIGQLPHMVGDTADIAVVWAITEMALDRGLTVMLKPMVDVQWEHGWFGGWRGAVALRGELYGAFTAHYNAFLRPYAELAHDYDCVLCLGTEMLQITRDHGWQFWYEQHHDVQEAASCNTTYAANWGHVNDEGAEYKLVEPMYSAPANDRLVWAGVDAYYNFNSMEQARTEMQAIAMEMASYSMRTNKPVVFTEVGWPHRDYALTEPWGREDHGGAPTFAQSVPLWEMFLEEVAPWLEGYFVWEVGYGSTGRNNGSHNVLSTPIEDFVWR